MSLNASEDFDKLLEEWKAKYQQNQSCLLTAPPELTTNSKFMLEMVKMDGRLLFYIDNNLNQNEEIAMAAVQQNGLALEFVHYELKQNNFNINYDAVTQNGLALVSVAPNFKKDLDIVIRAIIQSPEAIQYVLPGTTGVEQLVELSAIANRQERFDKGFALLNELQPPIIKGAQDDAEFGENAKYCGFFPPVDENLSNQKNTPQVQDSPAP